MNTLGTEIFDLISDGVPISGETFVVESCYSPAVLLCVGKFHDVIPLFGCSLKISSLLCV